MLAACIVGPTLSQAINEVGFVACGMVWNASRVFHGRKPNLPGLILGAIAGIAGVTMLPPASTALRLTIAAGMPAIHPALNGTAVATASLRLRPAPRSAAAAPGRRRCRQ